MNATLFFFALTVAILASFALGCTVVQFQFAAAWDQDALSLFLAAAIAILLVTWQNPSGSCRRPVQTDHRRKYCQHD